MFLKPPQRKVELARRESPVVFSPQMGMKRVKLSTSLPSATAPESTILVVKGLL